VIGTFYGSQPSWLWSARHSHISDVAPRAVYSIPAGWWGRSRTAIETPSAHGPSYDSRPCAVQVITGPVGGYRATAGIGAGPAGGINPGPDHSPELP